MMNKLAVIILFAALVTSSIAQNNHATGLAFGKNYMSAAMGIDAFFISPGNLALHTEGTEFTIFSPGFGISNSAFSISEYGRFFTEKGNKGTWSTKDKRDLRDVLKDGLKLPFSVEINIFSIVYKNMGFGMEFVTGGSFETNSAEFAEIALFGLKLTPDYNFNTKDIMKGSFYSAFRYSFAYSHIIRKRYFPLKLENITFGGKVGYYSGLSYEEVDHSGFKIKRSKLTDPNNDEELVEYKLKFKTRSSLPGHGEVFPGSGMGLDLGSSATFDDKWHFSIRLENIIGFLNWDANTEGHTFLNSDSLYIFNDDGVDRKTEVDTTQNIKAFSTSLPANLHIGVNYRLRKNLLLTAQYRQGLNEAFGNVYIPRIGVGAEYRPLKWLPLRTGMSVGGKTNFLMGLGAGIDLKIFEFNLAYAMRESFLWPNFSAGAFLAFDFKFKL